MTHALEQKAIVSFGVINPHTSKNANIESLNLLKTDVSSAIPTEAAQIA